MNSYNVNTWDEDTLLRAVNDPLAPYDLISQVYDELRARARGKPQVHNGHTILGNPVVAQSWSYADYAKGLPQESEHRFRLPDGVSVRTKDCRCESRHLFAFGHEKQCDYFEEKKR